LALLALAIGLSACRSQQAVLTEHQEKLESLGASTAAIARAWLAGAASGTYTRTAFEQTYQLVEQQRSALAKTSDALVDARGAQLSDAAERLSRLLAHMIQDVEQRDASALRRHVAEIPIRPREVP
jgi:hypothetical protein